MPSRQTLFDRKRQSEGWREITLWLSPSQKLRLDLYASERGINRQQALREAVESMSTINGVG